MFIVALSKRSCQHEKFSSQLQLNQKKPPEGEASRSEVKPSVAAAAPVSEGAAAKPPETGRAEDKMSGDAAHRTVYQCHGNTIITINYK